MPRKQPEGTRSLDEIFELAAKIGAENVDLTDAELGALLTGGTKPLSAGTVANRRSRGDLPLKAHCGADRTPLTNLAEALAYKHRHLQKLAKSA